MASSVSAAGVKHVNKGLGLRWPGQVLAREQSLLAEQAAGCWLQRTASVTE